MHALIKVFLEICWFRRGPQDIPTASVLRNLAVIVYTLTGTLVALGAQETPERAILGGLIDATLIILLTTALLWFLGKPERLTQTLTALTGCGTLLNLISYPMLLLFYAAGESPFVSLLLSAVAIWNIMVVAHILRHAIGQPLFVGMALAIVYVVTILLTINWTIKSLT
ncbi:MAG: hypothetical protein AB1810_08105 [Pseudomonadota bacterium]